ncbi:MAG: ABC transporter permease [Oscillospiraceae bacterium]|nr:ABC transporter permease [Oscillospiraceae bacterium]
MIFKSKIPAVPYIVWGAVFIIVPLILIAIFAFTDSSGSFTFMNVSEVAKFGTVFLRSGLLALVATVVCLVMAYPLAFMMSRMNERYQSLFMMLIMLPMWMNYLLRTYAWMALLENNGLINKFFALFGLGPFQMINTEGAIVLGMVYNYLPFMALPLYTVMLKIDRSVIYAAQDLGAGFFAVFVRVVFPLSKPGVMSGITMVFVPAVSTFIISRMLGGGTNLLVGDLIEQQFLGNTYNPHLGSAISLVLMIFVLLSMALLNQFDADETEGMIV